jgi:hypothetical protein
MARTFVLFAATLGICFALGEIVLRVAGVTPPPIGAAPADPAVAGFGWAEPDPVVGWLSRPGVQRWIPPNDAPMTFLSDHRRASWAGERPDARDRVLLVGCSYSAGLGVADTDTFAWRLNDALPALRIENHATSAWSTWQSLRRAEQLLAGDGATPALVVYAYMGNHDQRNVSRYEWLEGLETTRPGTHLVPPHVTLDGDALVEHPLAILEPWPLEGRSAWLTLAHDLALRAQYRRSKQLRREVTERLLLRFDASTHAAGARLLVALLADVDPDSELLRFLADHRIEFVDCQLPGWREDTALHLANDVHPSPLAHARWAACLAPALARLSAR